MSFTCSWQPVPIDEAFPRFVRKVGGEVFEQYGNIGLGFISKIENKKYIPWYNWLDL